MKDGHVSSAGFFRDAMMMDKGVDEGVEGPDTKDGVDGIDGINSEDGKELRDFA